MTKIEIDKKVYKKLKGRAQKLGFEKVEDYIADILEQVARKIKDKRKKDKEEVDEEEIKKKLRGLGYF